MAIDFELRLQQLMVLETFRDNAVGNLMSEDVKDDIAQHQLSIHSFGIEGKDKQKKAWNLSGLSEQSMVPLDLPYLMNREATSEMHDLSALRDGEIRAVPGAIPVWGWSEMLGSFFGSFSSWEEQLAMRRGPEERME
jgi:hypothetical protein